VAAVGGWRRWTRRERSANLAWRLCGWYHTGSNSSTRRHGLMVRNNAAWRGVILRVGGVGPERGACEWLDWKDTLVRGFSVNRETKEKPNLVCERKGNPLQRRVGGLQLDRETKTRRPRLSMCSHTHNRKMVRWLSVANCISEQSIVAERSLGTIYYAKCVENLSRAQPR
jgi:hypothetical protein